MQHPPPRKLILGLALVCIAMAFYVGKAADNASRTYIFRGSTMGTSFAVKVVAPATVQVDQAQLKQRIFAALDAVDASMSTYQPNSELSRFNRAPANTLFAVSPATAEVFTVAQRVAQMSGGAMDVTVGPLVDAWGFGPAPKPEHIPTAEHLQRLRAASGYGHLRVQVKPPALQKDIGDLRCDLSAIAKGYGVDRVSELLTQAGFARHMVEVGGEVRASGYNANDEPWRIGIESPETTSTGQAVQEIVLLHDLAMATSGDYRNYYEHQGKRYSHTIDPRNGAPVTHRLASVTVAHAQAVWADALATAIDVLGPEEGLAFARREGLAAYLLVREDGDRFSRQMTPAFARLLGHRGS